jgi:hypothetical protein
MVVRHPSVHDGEEDLRLVDSTRIDFEKIVLQHDHIGHLANLERTDLVVQ